MLYGDPIRWERIEQPPRDEQQEVANAIFAEIRALYERLEAQG